MGRLTLDENLYEPPLGRRNNEKQLLHIFLSKMLRNNRFVLLARIAINSHGNTMMTQ